MGIEKYEAIIGHEHHVSTRHQRMSALDRAAQFAPFAALTGYESVIEETGRQTQERVDLDEMQMQNLNEAMMTIQERLSERPKVSLTRFVPDSRKKGGSYEDMEGRVRNIDHAAGTMILCDGSIIPLRNLTHITLSPELEQDQ